MDKRRKALEKRRVGTWIKEEELWKENKGSTVYMDKRRRRRMKHGCKKKENSGRREGW